MANQVNLLNYANTFGDWVATTNALSRENNDLAVNNYHKNSGTLYLDTGSLALQSNGNAIFAQQLAVQGVGSYVDIQNNASVGGQFYLTNTTIGLIASGAANISGPIFALGQGTGLTVANNTNLLNNLNVTGKTELANTLSVISETTLYDKLTVSGVTVISNTVSISGTTSISDDVTMTKHLSVSDTITGYNNLSIAYTTVTNDLTATANIVTNSIQANTTVNTSVLTVSANASTKNLQVYANTITENLQANTRVNTSILTASANVTANNLQANFRVNTSFLTASANATANNLQANFRVNTSILTVSANASTKNLQVYANTITENLQANTRVNTSILTSTTLNVSANGTANNLQVNSRVNTSILTVAGKLDANSATYAYLPNTLITGSLQISGNFVLSGNTTYTTPYLTLAQGGAVNQNGYLNVFRPNGANASLRWNEGGLYWDALDVTTSTYSKLLTANLISDSLTSTSSSTVASSNAVYFLSDAVVNTISPAVTSAFNRANSSISQITGTTGSAAPTNPAGGLTFTSTNGMSLAGSGSTITINTAQDLRTTASPTFQDLTLTNALPVTQGGTGATSSSGALTNLLPDVTGVNSGYVLATGGPGSFYWAAGGTGGGGGAVPGTTINSTRLTYTATNSTQTVFTIPTFNISTQVRPYINGVRQFESEYTLQQVANTITFSTAPVSGDKVLIEVDGYIINPYYANNIVFTAPSGGIPSSANTIQLAIENIESRKAPLASPTLTGTPTAVTATTGTNSTQIATTQFVNNTMNSGSVFAHSISGTALNGVVTTGSYSNPDWITGIANTKIIGLITSSQISSITSGQVTTALGFTPYNSTNPSGYTTNVGTVTSVGGTGTVSGLTLSGTVTGTGSLTLSGTLSVAPSNFSSQTAATFLAAPNGSAGVPTFRTIVAADIPTLNQSTSGSAATFTSTTQNSQFNSIGVGTAASATAGEIRATNNITAYYSSDIKYKENVQNVTDALDKVVYIGTKYFDWKDSYIDDHGGEDGYFVKKSDFGVVAQDVQKVFPQAVREREDGSLAVDYAKLGILSFAAIGELLKRIEILESK